MGMKPSQNHQNKVIWRHKGPKSPIKSFRAKTDQMDFGLFVCLMMVNLVDECHCKVISAS